MRRPARRRASRVDEASGGGAGGSSGAEGRGAAAGGAGRRSSRGAREVHWTGRPRRKGAAHRAAPRLATRRSLRRGVRASAASTTAASSEVVDGTGARDGGEDMPAGTCGIWRGEMSEGTCVVDG